MDTVDTSHPLCSGRGGTAGIMMMAAEKVVGAEAFAVIAAI